MRFFLYHKRFGGQMFEVDESIADELKAQLYPLGWRKNKFEAARADEEPQRIDLRTASDSELERMARKDLEREAREQLGVELDRRKTVKNMVRELRDKME